MHRHQAAQARVLKAKVRELQPVKRHKRAVKQRPGPEAPPAHSSPAAPRIRVRYAVDVLAGRLHSSRASAVANPVSSQSARPPALTASSAPLRSCSSPSHSPAGAAARRTPHLGERHRRRQRQDVRARAEEERQHQVLRDPRGAQVRVPGRPQEGLPQGRHQEPPRQGWRPREGPDRPRSPALPSRDLVLIRSVVVRGGRSGSPV